MTATFEDDNSAVRAFWAGRDLQTQRQIDSGRIDAGLRGSVTGGQHLTPLQDVIADQFAPLVAMGVDVRRTGVIPLPMPSRCARCRRRTSLLPSQDGWPISDGWDSSADHPVRHVDRGIGVAVLRVVAVSSAVAVPSVVALARPLPFGVADLASGVGVRVK